MGLGFEQNKSWKTGFTPLPPHPPTPLTLQYPLFVTLHVTGHDFLANYYCKLLSFSTCLKIINDIWRSLDFIIYPSFKV